MNRTYSGFHKKLYLLFTQQHKVVLKKSIIDELKLDPEGKWKARGKDILSTLHGNKPTFIGLSRTKWISVLNNRSGNREELAHILAKAIDTNYVCKHSKLSIDDFSDDVSLEDFIAKIGCPIPPREIETSFLIYMYGPKKQFLYNDDEANNSANNFVGTYELIRQESKSLNKTKMYLEIFDARKGLFENKGDLFFSVNLSVPSLRNKEKFYTYVGKATEKREGFIYIVLSEASLKQPDFSFLILHKTEDGIGSGSMLTVQQDIDGEKREPVIYEKIEVNRVSSSLIPINIDV